MKKISTIISGAVMITFLSSFLHLIFGDSMKPGNKMAHQISAQIGKKLEAKYGLCYQGISEEAPRGKYICIGISTSYPQILSRDEGRVLLLNCMEDMLAEFNSHPEFRPYMDNYPFNGDNIIVNIFIQPPKSFDVYYPDISVFSFFNDQLVYSTDIPEKPLVYYTREKETLEEARMIVEEQRAGKRPFVKSKFMK